MSKKARSEEPVVVPLVPDASVHEKEAIAQRWNATAEEPLQVMEEVQVLLQSLTSDLEQAQHEVAEIEGEFLQLLQFKPRLENSLTFGRKGKGEKKKDGEIAAAAGGQEVPGGSLRQAELAFRSLDERKSHKVTNALVALFRFHSTAGVRGMNHPAGATSGSGAREGGGGAFSSKDTKEGTQRGAPADSPLKPSTLGVSETAITRHEGGDTSGGGVGSLSPYLSPSSPVLPDFLPTVAQSRTEVVPTASPTPNLSVPISSGGVGGGESHADFPRRPKDCPPVLWEETIAFRLRRLMAEQKVRHLYDEVEKQVKRFSILQAMYELCIYSSSSAKMNYTKAFAEWKTACRSTVLPPHK